jgi:hypothetical protein
LVKLKEYLSAFGVNVPAEYLLSQVRSISGDGLTFGGVAYNLVTKHQEGFVATIPSPASSLLLMAPCLAWRRKRG